MLTYAATDLQDRVKLCLKQALMSADKSCESLVCISSRFQSVKKTFKKTSDGPAFSQAVKVPRAA